MQTSSEPQVVADITNEVFNNPQPAESEDCLYLNVFAPATDTPGKAVMFWIYGGNLQFGNAGAHTPLNFFAVQPAIMWY